MTTPAGTGGKADAFTVNEKETPKKSSNKGVWIGVGIAAGVVVVGAAAAIVYVVMRKRAAEDRGRPSRRR